MTTAFQRGAFQRNAFQIDSPTVTITGNVGGRIVRHRRGDELKTGASFRRKRWEDLQEAEQARIESARLADALEQQRAAELKQAADAQARAALRARWAQEDALSGTADVERALQAAMAAFGGAQGLGRNAQEAAMMRHAAIRAQQDLDDEDEAIALLMLS